MRVLVTGGRQFTSYEDRMWLYEGLNLIHSIEPITEIIEGGANGFDHHAHNWALWRMACGDTIVLTTCPADWETHGRSAGPIRNETMAEMKPDLVLVCPGRDGTADMAKRAKDHGLKRAFLELMPVSKPRPTASLAIPAAA